MRDVPTDNSTATYLYFAFKVISLFVSAFCIYLGYKLFILGVTGVASISIESKDIKGQLLNAAPGLFFAVGGIIALIVIVVKGVDMSFQKMKNGRSATYKSIE